MKCGRLNIYIERDMRESKGQERSVVSSVETPSSDQCLISVYPGRDDDE